MQPLPAPSGRFARWRCIATNYGHQSLAESTIRADGWPVYAPECLDRRRNRITPLFVGYLFALFDAEADDWPRICRCRGVYRILGRIGRPEPIPVGVIEGLMARTSARNVVDDPGDATNIVQFNPGERARVATGPLAGFEGICSLSSRERVTLLLSLFGRQTPTRFNPAELERA